MIFLPIRKECLICLFVSSSLIEIVLVMVMVMGASSPSPQTQTESQFWEMNREKTMKQRDRSDDADYELIPFFFSVCVLIWRKSQEKRGKRKTHLLYFDPPTIDQEKSEVIVVLIVTMRVEWSLQVIQLQPADCSEHLVLVWVHEEFDFVSKCKLSN